MFSLAVKRMKKKKTKHVTNGKAKSTFSIGNFSKTMHIWHWVFYLTNRKSQKITILVRISIFSEKIRVTRVFSVHCTFEIQEEKKCTHAHKQLYQIKIRLLMKIIILYAAFHYENRCRAHQNLAICQYVCVLSNVEFPTKNELSFISSVFFLYYCDCCWFSLRFSHFNMPVINQFYCCIV